MTEDIGDALITVQVLSGELADGVSVDVEFTTAFGGSAAGKEVVTYYIQAEIKAARDVSTLVCGGDGVPQRMERLLHRFYNYRLAITNHAIYINHAIANY